MGLTLDANKGRAIGNYRMFNIENEHDEIICKASFIILSNAICSDKIFGNFDLVVIGDMSASSIEVKGKLICFGSIKADKVVAKEIVASNIVATEIETADGIMAQKIDANIIKSDGTIHVGKNITVENLIETRENIVCGEGLYAYGKVKAKTIIAADNIDITDAVENNEIQNEPLIKTFESKGKVESIAGEYKGWRASKIKEIEQLISAKNLSGLQQYLRQNFEFDFIDNYVFAVDIVSKLMAVPQRDRVNDLVWFLDLHKVICETPTMKQFGILAENYRAYNEAFGNAVKTNLFEANVKCEFIIYSDFIEAITIIQKYGDKIDKQLFLHVIDKVYNSGLGVKATYLNSIFQRRGWKING